MAEELDKEFAEQETEEVSDPFSGYNRAMTVFNDKLFTLVLDPVGRSFRFVLPEYSRRGIANFFDNLLYPVRLVNNLLQAKFANSGEETLRFVTNSTVGIFGLWDPAEKLFGLEAHDEDFGQTLGYWGLGSGPHIVLPFLGPSNLRDMFALVPDYYLDPASYIDSGDTQLKLRVFKEVNNISLRIGEYENLKRDALDLYPFLREVYEQNRAKKILE
ncbi:MAG: VacJ family lipoprotein [SAR324 cluster bacterium]|nr:VacJ family lipoprotein [SAR324 cluster bacterium]